MPRFFEPDETKEVSVKLTRKDWLVLSQVLNGVVQQFKRDEMRDKLRELALDIISQANK